MDLIDDSQTLKFLQGDIFNAFIQAHSKEKMFTKCGPEFGDSVGAIAIIERALYGLTTSAKRFRTMLEDFLRTLDFVPSLFDKDDWMRLCDDKSECDYICTQIKLLAKGHLNYREMYDKVNVAVKKKGYEKICCYSH